MLKSCSFLLLFAYFSLHLHAQYLDSSFGVNGIVRRAGIYQDSSHRSIEGFILNDGKPLLKFNANSDNIPSQAELYSENGIRDTAYGTKATTLAQVWEAGNNFFFGQTSNTISSSVVSYLNKLYYDGTPDPSFGVNGAITVNGFQDLITTADRKIITAQFEAFPFSGNRVNLHRYFPNGSVDSAFGIDGAGRLPTGNFSIMPVLRIQSNGKIILVGLAGSLGGTNIFIGRFNSNGILDTTFHETGSFLINTGFEIAQYDKIEDVIVQETGDVFIAMHSRQQQPKLIRISSLGIVNSPVSLPFQNNVSMVMLPGIKFLIGGSVKNENNDWEFSISRMLPDGSLDESFGNAGSVRTNVSGDNDDLKKLVLDRNRLYALGFSSTNIAVAVKYILDTLLPSVKIVQPATGENFTAGSTVSVLTALSDIDHGWKKIEFYSNGTKLAEDSIAPYAFDALNVEPGSYSVVAKAISNHGDTIASYAVNVTVHGCAGTGGITLEGFTNIPGSTVTALTNDPSFPNNPSVLLTATLFEYAHTGGDNFGARARGYLCVPQTGLYSFYIASDEQSELWLSTDDNPSNKKRIAFLNNAVGFRAWYVYPSQHSAPLSLIRGVKYYIETLHKESTGDDHLSVAWALPDGTLEAPVAGNHLILWDNGNRAEHLFNATNNFKTAKLPASNMRIISTPNPFISASSITIASSINAPVSMIVTDMLGRILERKEQVRPNSMISIGLNLKTGVYVVEAMQAGKTERCKIVKQ